MFRSKKILSLSGKNKSSKIEKKLSKHDDDKLQKISPSESPEGSISSDSNCPCENNDNSKINIFDYVQKMSTVSYKVVVQQI